MFSLRRIITSSAWSLSALAVLTRGSPAFAQNDTCETAIDVGLLPAVVSGSTLTATMDHPMVDCWVPIEEPGVWYTVTGTGNAMLATTCSLADASASDDFNSRISVFAGSCNTPGEEDIIVNLTCVSGSSLTTECDNAASARWCSDIGVTYFILVHGFSETDPGSGEPILGTGDFTMVARDDGTCSGPPANDLCENAEHLTLNNRVLGTTLWATGTDLSRTDGCGAVTKARDVWYSVDVTANIEHTFTVSNAEFTENISIFDNCNGFPLSGIVGNGRVCVSTFGEDNSRTFFYTPLESKRIWIRVASSRENIGGSFSIEAGAIIPTGACCLGTDCVSLTEQECLSQGGIYQGDNVSCGGGEPAGTPVTFESGAINLPIPDPGAAQSTIISSFEGDAPQIGSVEVTVNILHENIGDLTIDLVNMDTGTTVRLYNQFCLESPSFIEDMFITFSSGSEAIELSGCSSPLAPEGPVGPHESLEAFVGESANTTWKLVVTDTLDVLSGSISNWSINVDTLVGGITCEPVACPCDYNASDAVDFFDLLDFLDAWFAGNADFNSSGGTDFFDLLDFLDCWFAASGGNCP